MTGTGRGRPRAECFRATILRQGPNPYVDVPEGVTRSFSAYARAGRVRFEGTLNGVGIRGALIPVGRGRHRLYVNGGMRAAAGVGVGDRVTLELRATAPEKVTLPADVAAGLRRVKGAREAFDHLPTSHRRELLRYIDDARTPETRGRRIEKTAEHALGRPVSSPRDAARIAQRPLWTCRSCGNQFVNRNQYHSCRRLTLDAPFAGKPPSIRQLFDRFRAIVLSCGPVKTVVYRDKVSFMVRVRFAGAVPRRRWLDVAFWLPRRIESPRFRKVETILANAHVHLLRVEEPEDLDHELAGWIREAYAVGRQEHLTGRPANLRGARGRESGSSRRRTQGS